jgi:trimeric autotransporter adhesin
MPSSIPEISQLISRCIFRHHSRSLRHGLLKAFRPSHFFAMVLLLLVSWRPLVAQLVQVNSISTIAGTPGSAGDSGDGGKATGAKLISPGYVLTDSAGNIFIVDVLSNRVRKIAAKTGIITTVAGNGTSGFSGDGGAATSAELNTPAGIALDAVGNLYIADAPNNRVRKVNATTGIITTVAGNGAATTSSGDGGPATNAGLIGPVGIAVDSAGDIFVTDNGEHGVREISATTGVITTVISNGSTPSSGFGAVAGIAIDGSGNLFIADPVSHRVFKLIAASGAISIVAGNGTAGSSGDGGPATSAELNYSGAVALDTAGNLYINDALSNNIRKVSAATGIISTVAGDGTAGFSGDGGAAVDAEINDPGGVALDSAGNLYIPEGNNNDVREVSPLAFPATNVASSSAPQNLLLETTSAETITSFTVSASQGNKQEYKIGTVSGCVVDGVTSNPAGTICTIPITFSPGYPGLRPVPIQAVTSAGNVNIGLNGLGVGPLAALTPGIITTIAGNGASGYTGDGGPATSAGIYEPQGVALDNAGDVYFADFYHHVVRRIDVTSGVITTVAGNGTEGSSGDGGTATSAELNYPEGISLDSAANIYIADSGNYRVRKVDAATGIITTVAGDGAKTDSGDGGLAVNAGFRAISDVKFDSHDNMYIADSLSVRRVDVVSGTITTIAGNGPGGDGVLAIDSYVYPYSLAFDSLDNLYLVSPTQGNVRVITAANGYINTIAGNGVPNSKHSGDGGPATGAGLAQPDYVAVDSAGDLYISEAAGSYIRMVTASTQIISTIGGTGLDDVNLPGDGGPATAAAVASPTGIALDGFGNIYIGSYVAERIRKINVSESALVWPTPTNVGISDSSDDPETAILTDIGNFQMKVPFATSPADPVITSGWLLDSTSSCSPNGLTSLTLNSGQACTLPVDFTPTASGTNNGTLVLTDNSLNVPTSTQTISLTGTGVGQAAGPQPVLTPATINFGSLTVGTTSAAQTATLSNTGGVPQSISSFGFFGNSTSSFTQSNNCGPSLAAGASCSIAITCTPAAAGSLSANLGANFPSPEPQLSIALTCTGTAAAAPQVTLTPASLSFTTVAGSTPAPQVATLTNGGTAALVISQMSIGGATGGAFAQTNTCGTSLAAGASCAITVSFSGTGVGSYVAALQVADNAPSTPQAVTLSGTVTAASAPAATLTPASLAFSTTTGTTSATQNATLTNTGHAPLTITGISLTGVNSAVFISTNTCGSTLAAGASCTISMTFDPTSTGTDAATLSVSDNAPGSPQTSSLTGVATAPPAATDFSIAATPASQSVTAGGSVAYQVNLASINGSFTQPVTFVASGLPTGATVTFTPASVIPGSAGSSSTMTIQTPVQQAAGGTGPPLWPFTAPVFAAALLLFPGKRFRPGKKGLRVFTNFVCIMALLGLAASTIGCGAGFALPSSAKTYTITVTGASGSDTHSTTVTLTVQ